MRRNLGPDYLADETTGCWMWQKARTGNGYGAAWRNGRQVPAHRAYYEQHRGPIPAGLVIDHLCRTPLCVNPDHLEAVTNRENVVARGRNAVAQAAAATSCPAGHPYAGANLYRRPDGARVCRTCQREAGRRYDARRRRSSLLGA